MKTKSTTPTEEGYVATAVELAAWKKKHGEVTRIQVGEKACYVRNPDRTIMKMVNATTDGEYIERQETILENIWLGGDEEIKTDDVYFLNVIPVINELIPSLAVSLAKK